MDDLKTDVVHAYLRNWFPGHQINDLEDFGHDGRVFEVMWGADCHCLFLERHVLEMSSSEELARRLNAWQIATCLRRAGGRRVVVTSHGVSMAPD